MRRATADQQRAARQSSTTAHRSSRFESVYLQDEWKPLTPFTLNYGLRFDHYSAYSSGSQLSPRVNFVWEFPYRHDGARRLLALFHPAAVRADRRGDLHQIRRHDRRAAGLRHAGHSPDRRARQLLRLRRAAEAARQDSYARRRQLLRAGAAPDRRGTVRRADHSHAVQLPLRPDRRRGVHRQLLRSTTSPPI